MLKARLLSKVVAGPQGCWVWTDYISPKGYGRFWDGSRIQLAHRVSYELHRGPITEGLQIDHLCRNRRCIRPDHLEVVTSRENWQRGNSITRALADKAMCPSGHPYNHANTRMCQGRRYCRACDNLRRLKSVNPEARARQNAYLRERYRRLGHQ